MEWKPITELPKEDCPCLCWFDDGMYGIAYFSKEGKSFSIIRLRHKVTHYAVITPPTNKEKTYD